MLMDFHFLNPSLPGQLGGSKWVMEERKFSRSAAFNFSSS